MITAKLVKLELPSIGCKNTNCKFNPDFHYKIISDSNLFYIKPGTICAVISMSGDHKDLAHYEVYCRQCIDEVYNQLRPVLDSKLWYLL